MVLPISTISKSFQIWGQFMDAFPYGSGHINDTYAVRFDQGGIAVRYIFQRINHNVFNDIPGLMQNIVRVTKHLGKKLLAQGNPEISRRTMNLIPTREGGNYHIDHENNFWRVFIFIENARTYNTLKSADQAYEAARAFGQFQAMLVDLPFPPLQETFPGFHDGPHRFNAFLQALEKDVKNRAVEAKPEIAFLKKHQGILEVLPKAVEKGSIPLRSTHNDTKINNVLIDDLTGEAICVIDLDTLMPGLVLYDFGDMVRTCTCSAREDEKDLNKIVMQMPMFEKLVQGYLSTAGSFLNDTEKQFLAFSGKLITLIIGIRFLTDFLVGDVYFKVHREKHNLDRCRTQFKLVQSCIEQEEAMEAVVEKY